jgi:hypothetical protein
MLMIGGKSVRHLKLIKIAIPTGFASSITSAQFLISHFGIEKVTLGTWLSGWLFSWVISILVSLAFSQLM